MKRNLRTIRHIWTHSRHPLRTLWTWAKRPRKPRRRLRRWRALEAWANRRRKAAPAGSAKRRGWAKVADTYDRKADRLEHELTQGGWPKHGSFTELLYHAPGPHVHAASADRAFLIRVFGIGQERYGLRIGEFPPFDVVEDVHVDGSWHYRDSSSPWTPRSFSNRGDGLAADINDLDGGSDQEVAFFNELRRRYT